MSFEIEKTDPFEWLNEQHENANLFEIETLPTFYRLQAGGNRRYFKVDANFNPTFYESVTTVIKAGIPAMEQKYLNRWREDQESPEAADRIAAERADYGTAMHVVNTRYLIARSKGEGFDASEAIRNTINALREEKMFAWDTDAWIFDLTCDLYAFAKWVEDWQVTPIVIERVMGSEKYGVAGALDLICELTSLKTGRRFKAIVDYKSGKKGFWVSHKIQLHIYRAICSENLPELGQLRVFNWAPKDWAKTARKQIAYSFEEQTQSEAIEGVLTHNELEDSVFAYLPYWEYVLRAGKHLLTDKLGKTVIFKPIEFGASIDACVEVVNVSEKIKIKLQNEQDNKAK